MICLICFDFCRINWFLNKIIIIKKNTLLNIVYRSFKKLHEDSCVLCMAKSYSNGKDMEEVYRQYYEDIDDDEDVDEGKEDIHKRIEQKDAWIEQEKEQEDV